MDIHEQTIIKEIFGENNIVVAHGKAQNIRSSELHWNRGHKDDEYRIVHTRKALRMKSNLSNFVKKFADVSLKNNEFTTLIKDDESIGGQIYLVIGNYFKDPSIHKGIINNQPDDIKTIDNLFCIYEKGIAEEYQKHLGICGLAMTSILEEFNRASLIMQGLFSTTHAEAWRGGLHLISSLINSGVLKSMRVKKLLNQTRTKDY